MKVIFSNVLVKYTIKKKMLLINNKLIRDTLIFNIKKVCADFDNYDREQRVRYILNPATAMEVNIVGSFLIQSIELRTGDPWYLILLWLIIYIYVFDMCKYVQCYICISLLFVTNYMGSLYDNKVWIELDWINVF